MKAFLVLAAAGAVVAQNFGNEPSCAIPCLTSAIAAAGCKLDDQACQCGPSQAAIGAKVIGCFATACSPSDIGVAASVGSSLCAAFSKTAASGPASTTTGAVTTTTGPAMSTTVSVITTTSGTDSVASITPAPTTNNGTFSGPKPTTTTRTTSNVTNAAATAGALGFGAVAALLGAVAAL